MSPVMLLGLEPWIRVLGRHLAGGLLQLSCMPTTGAEAPRPAHARIDGRSPGSRVGARHRLPGFSPVAQWCGLAAYSCGGSCGIGSRKLIRIPYRIPCWLSDERPSIATT